MSVFQPSTSKSLTSTPLKSKDIGVYRSRSVDNDSPEDSTYSLLSPIYHESFEGSDDDLDVEQLQQGLNNLRAFPDEIKHTIPHRYLKLFAMHTFLLFFEGLAFGCFAYVILCYVM